MGAPWCWPGGYAYNYHMPKVTYIQECPVCKAIHESHFSYEEYCSEHKDPRSRTLGTDEL